MTLKNAGPPEIATSMRRDDTTYAAWMYRAVSLLSSGDVVPLMGRSLLEKNGCGIVPDTEAALLLLNADTAAPTPNPRRMPISTPPSKKPQRGAWYAVLMVAVSRYTVVVVVELKVVAAGC